MTNLFLIASGLGSLAYFIYALLGYCEPRGYWVSGRDILGFALFFPMEALSLWVFGIGLIEFKNGNRWIPGVSILLASPTLVLGGMALWTYIAHEY